MNKVRLIAIGFLCFCFFDVYSQTNEIDNVVKDSIYLSEVEDQIGKPKILHAEPLFIDLIRDLGARKGEKEWNVGIGLTDNIKYDEYVALVEYEWAVIDRLGLEVEVPCTFYYGSDGNGERPGSKINSLKLAAQYTFLVSEARKTSLALGYIHEFEMPSFSSYGKQSLYKGNVYNPFFVAAKRFGNNLHTLLYTGPMIHQYFKQDAIDFSWEINSNFHYMISGTRNFIGVEFNKQITNNDFDMTIRPQMRVAVSEKLLIGIVTGIPVSREIQRFSTFLRIIYEP